MTLEIIAQYSDNDIISAACAILEEKLTYQKWPNKIKTPLAAKTLCKLRLADLEHEVFCVLFLDTRNRLISFDIMFQGTIDGASIYPREVLKAALKHNASSVMLAHNHPSGSMQPSDADKRITTALTGALNMIEVKVLDHLIVAGNEVFSFAEAGYL